MKLTILSNPGEHQLVPVAVRKLRFTCLRITPRSLMMEQGNPPQCTFCHTVLTLKYTLIDWVFLREVLRAFVFQIRFRWCEGWRWDSLLGRLNIFCKNLKIYELRYPLQTCNTLLHFTLYCCQSFVLMVLYHLISFLT